MEKDYVDGHGDVRSYDEESNHDTFKEVPIDEEEWIKIQTTGGGAET